MEKTAVLSSTNFVKADGIDGFEQIIEESRFLFGFLCYKARTFAHYIIPDKIMYNKHNVTINYGASKKINLMTVDHNRPNLGNDLGNVSLTFYKSDGSDLDLYFLTSYINRFMNIRAFNDDTLKKCVGSLDAFSSLLVLRCRSAFEEGVPIGSAISDNINTPEFYYMAKDLYGIDHVRDLLQQFMDYGLPFPDYILKIAIDSGDLEYAAALVHEKDALQMSGKEEVLRL